MTMAQQIRFRAGAALILLTACIAGAVAESGDIDALLAAALAGEHREAANRARDGERHPAQTLRFFGLEPDQRVIEVQPGRGWYTEILAPVLRERGKLLLATYGKDNASEYLRSIDAELTRKLAAHPGVYDRVEPGVLDNRGTIDLGPPGSADLVLVFRSVHNWIRFGGIERAFREIHTALKTGGTLGVVQHRASDGADPEQSAQRGYVPERYLVGLLEGMGFELVATSDINANPRDTKDYEKGVWTLPPSFRLGERDRERYAAIGESDRMTLRFVKR